MNNDSQKVNFSFGWLALKLLGKSLYSNAWSALSELVANGFDANAKNVYIYINIENKADAVIEIIDDGSGMDRDDISTYVKVGFNKRIDSKKSTDIDYLTMGRKGIGKLAALFLSESYYLVTKTTDTFTKWQMIYQENASDEDERPYLSETNDEISLACDEIWDCCTTGTILQMNHVNLAGLGDTAYNALEKKLSNIFALDAMGKRKIHLCVQSTNGKHIAFNDFAEVKKEIAFKNMAFIDYDLPEGSSNVREEIIENGNVVMKFPFSKLNGNQFYSHQCETEKFEQIESIQTCGEYTYIKEDGTMGVKPYILTGWIGLHGSIDHEQALLNDERFTKNRFYNPIQLRLYVRNKLAIENFLNVINNTQAFVNYIEGEIHFDILDDDDLPDIATSNRQSLDEHDGRVQLLVEIIKKIVTNLISKRTDLAKEIKKQQDFLYIQQTTNAKRQFTKEVESEVAGLSGLSPSEKSTLTTMISNKIVGDVTPKNDYIIFISHSSKDKLITDFIYQMLKYKGARDDEFFYTSRDDTVNQYENIDSLSMQIKENILKENVLLLYLTSKDYKGSEFCMFEGGAGWATRSVGEYIVLSMTYDEIPKFITNGKSEFCLEKDKNIPLNRQSYLFFRMILNKMIDHINAGRQANAEVCLAKFSDEEIPSDLILSRDNKTVADCMDKDIVEHWNYYVGGKLSEYMDHRYPVKIEADVCNAPS